MWDKEMLELLIIKYQQHDNLYNVRSPIYLDRVKRSNSLFAICQDLKTLNKDISVEDVKKKIHMLRGQYIKENRNICKSKRSGVGADDVYAPKLWYFPLLHFLKSHCIVRKSESNIFQCDDSEYESTILPEDGSINNAEVEAPSSSKKKKKPFNLEERMENIKKIITKKPEKQSSFDWIGKQVVHEIDRIKSESIKQDAVWEIQKILRRAWVKDTQVQPNESLFTPPESPFTTVSQETLFEYEILQSNASPDILEQSLIGVFDDDDDDL